VGKGTSLVLIGIVAGGIALRFAGLDAQSFWRDEASTALELHGSLGHALTSVRDLEGMPPGYFGLAWLWSRPFGVSEAGLRSLSALIGVLTIPVAWHLGRVWSARAGLIAAALVAFNPFLVWYSQEARPYPLLVLTTALTVLCLVRDRRGWWAVAAAAALLTHYFAVFILAPQAYVLWRRGAWRALIAPAVVGAALLPLLASQHDNRVNWVRGTGLWERVVDTGKHWIAGEFGTPVNGIGLIALALIVTGLVVAGRDARARVLLGVIAAALILPLLAVVAGQDYVLDRYVIAALFPLLVTVAVGLDQIRRTVAATAALSALFAGFALTAAFDHELQRENWRAVARGVPDTLIIATDDAVPPMQWYLPGTAAAADPQTVDEVVFVASWRIGKPRAPTPPTPNGFRPPIRHDGPTTTVVRFTAPAPMPVDLNQLLSVWTPGSFALHTGR
jgi:uncharacterized membrane protein